MKTINKNKHKKELAEIIQALFLDMNPLVMWENLPGNGRVACPVVIHDVNNEIETLIFKLSKAQASLPSAESIYFYSEEQKVIFKANFVSAESDLIHVQVPVEVKVLDKDEENALSEMLGSFKDHPDFATSDPLADWSLDEPDQTSTSDGVDQAGVVDGKEEAWITDLSAHDANLFTEELSYVTLDEEDMQYEGDRQAPRAKPPEGKMVTVQLIDESKGQSTYSLYDLSQGGLSFLVFAQGEFAEGDDLMVKAFDTKEFETPMLLKVRAIREADDMGIQYKVGCQFVAVGS